MKIVYIAHKIGGDVEGNLEKIKAIASDILKNEPDVIPFAPYFFELSYLDDSIPEERERGLKHNLEIIMRGFIDELRVYSSVSSGVQQEIKMAREAGVFIRFMV